MARRMKITAEAYIAEEELRFRFSRSRGPGGQNVNKVATRVEISFDVRNSPSLTDKQKDKIISYLGSRIRGKGVVRVSADESRSQWRNRERAIAKLVEILRSALSPTKTRIPTKPTPRSKKERLSRKSKRSATKALRLTVKPED